MKLGARAPHPPRIQFPFPAPAEVGGCAPDRRLAPAASSPRGVTLFELLLVLVLLVIAGSMAIPAITGAFASVRLRRAGDAILAHWAQARARAVETGLPYQFTFTPESGDYRLEPWTGVPIDSGRTNSSSSASTTSSAATTAQVPAVAESTGQSLDESAIVAAKLPEPIIFQGGQLATTDPVSGEERVEALRAVGAEASTPVLFFPDGSASQATVVLQNDRSQHLRLTIRGLTGVARASAVLTSDEMDAGSETR